MESSAALPFVSPPSMRVRIPVPNAGHFEGMGIKRGVSIIVGGGVARLFSCLLWRMCRSPIQLPIMAEVSLANSLAYYGGGVAWFGRTSAQQRAM